MDAVLKGAGSFHGISIPYKLIGEYEDEIKDFFVWVPMGAQGTPLSHAFAVFVFNMYFKLRGRSAKGFSVKCSAAPITWSDTSLVLFADVGSSQKISNKNNSVE